MTVARIPCLDCVHFQGEARCAAFPEGIPLDFVNGVLHDTTRGDEVDGLTYEPAPGARDHSGRPTVETSATLARLAELAG